MLLLFDIDGTLIRSFLEGGADAEPDDYDVVEVLPGRRERLDALRAEGHHLALVTNQGGVAFGYQSVEQVVAKMAAVLAACGWATRHPSPSLPTGYAMCCAPESSDDGGRDAYVSFEHPKATEPGYKSDGGWRKPGAGMLRQAMHDYGASLVSTIFVGDMDSDRAAARAAGVIYVDAERFFRA